MLQEELNTLKKQGDAKAEEIKEGKTAVVQGELITGSMEDKSGQTVASNTITQSEDNALITVPESGYYDNTSKISVPIETIQNNVEVGGIKGTLTLGGSGVYDINTTFSDEMLEGVQSVTLRSASIVSGSSYSRYQIFGSGIGQGETLHRSEFTTNTISIRLEKPGGGQAGTFVFEFN